MSESLLKLAALGYMGDAFPWAFVHHLLDICEGQDAFEQAMQSLRSLRMLEMGPPKRFTVGPLLDVADVNSLAVSPLLQTTELLAESPVADASSEDKASEVEAIVPEVRLFS